MKTKPEINLARRLLSKFELAPPVPVGEIIRHYADVEVLDMPFDIDGVCIGLKVPGRRPRVIVNSRSRSPVRQRFTMAHELGHIVIPWHTGFIVDKLRPSAKRSDSDYWALEVEANRFASEFLMPTDWLCGIVQQHRNPVDMIEAVTRNAVVSFPAALIKIAANLPPGYTYACEQDGLIIASDHSRGTFTAPPQYETKACNYEFGSLATDEYRVEYNGRMHYWWRFEIAFDDVSAWPDGNWRELLNRITDGFGIDEADLKKFRMSLNGLIASANGGLKDNRSILSVYDACINRIRGAARHNYLIKRLVKHPEFENFLKMRVQAFFAPPPERRSKK